MFATVGPLISLGARRRGHNGKRLCLRRKRSETNRAIIEMVRVTRSPTSKRARLSPELLSAPSRADAVPMSLADACNLVRHRFAARHDLAECSHGPIDSKPVENVGFHHCCRPRFPTF